MEAQEFDVNYASRCSLNTLVDIALTMEITQLKKNDHSYSVYQKNRKHKPFATVCLSKDRVNPVNSDKATKERFRILSKATDHTYGCSKECSTLPMPLDDLRYSSNQLFTGNLSNVTEKCDPINDLNDCHDQHDPNNISEGSPILNTQANHVSVPGRNLNKKKEDLQSYNKLKTDLDFQQDNVAVKNGIDKPDHTYATGNKKFRSLDVPHETNIKTVTSVSAERLSGTSLDELQHPLVSKNKKCASDEQVNTSCVSVMPVISNSGCFTLPRAANGRCNVRRETPRDILITVTNIKGDGKNDHTYARHKWQDLSDIMDSMSEEKNSKETACSRTDHSYGKCTNKPNDTDSSTTKTVFRCGNITHGFNVDDFTSLNIGPSNKDHTYFGSV